MNEKGLKVAELGLLGWLARSKEKEGI